MIVLSISWIRIIDEFYKKYDSVFKDSVCKAHFDFIFGLVVDGPKEGWKPVILLDVLFCIFNDSNYRNATARRRFKQYNAFRESVMTACSEAMINELVHQNNSLDQELDSTKCNIVDIPDMWRSNDALKLYFDNSKRCKSKQKVIEAVTQYFNTDCMRNDGICIIINTAVNHIYSNVS